MGGEIGDEKCGKGADRVFQRGFGSGKLWHAARSRPARIRGAHVGHARWSRLSRASLAVATGGRPRRDRPGSSRKRAESSGLDFQCTKFAELPEAEVGRSERVPVAEVRPSYQGSSRFRSA